MHAYPQTHKHAHTHLPRARTHTCSPTNARTHALINTHTRTRHARTSAHTHTHTPCSTRARTSDVCFLLGAPLNTGLLSGEVVVCPWHDAKFSVRTGAVTSGPALEALRVYATRVDNTGNVFVAVPKTPQPVTCMYQAVILGACVYLHDMCLQHISCVCGCSTCPPSCECF